MSNAASPRICVGSSGLRRLAPTGASAQTVIRDGVSVSGWANAATDYPACGVSQSERMPAVQGSLEVSYDSGFYAGVYASSVRFKGINPSIEIDYQTGFRLKRGNFSADMQGVFVTHPEFNRPIGGRDISYFEQRNWFRYAAAKLPRDRHHDRRDT